MNPHPYSRSGSVKRQTAAKENNFSIDFTAIDKNNAKPEPLEIELNTGMKRQISLPRNSKIVH